MYNIIIDMLIKTAMDSGF